MERPAVGSGGAVPPNPAHRLHVPVVPDELCLARLRARNAAGGHPFAVREARFHQFSSHFAAPSPDKGLNLVVHDDARDAAPGF